MYIKQLFCNLGLTIFKQTISWFPPPFAFPDTRRSFPSSQQPSGLRIPLNMGKANNLHKHMTLYYITVGRIWWLAEYSDRMWKSFACQANPFLITARADDCCLSCYFLFQTAKCLFFHIHVFFLFYMHLCYFFILDIPNMVICSCSC